MNQLRPLHLDFGPTPAPASRWRLAILGAGLLACTAAAIDYQIETDNLAALEQQRRDLERQAARQPASQASGMRLAAAQAAEVTRQLRQPWDTLLGDLETAVGKSGRSVALLSIEPDAAHQQLRITGEAPRLANILAFVEHLEGTSLLRHAMLAEHQSRPRDGENVLAFTITAGWVENR